MKNNKTKTISENYIEDLESVGTCSDLFYTKYADFISYDITVDGKTLVIPKDITPYESAKLTQFMFVVTNSVASPQAIWELVEKLEIERLFK